MNQTAKTFLKGLTFAEKKTLADRCGIKLSSLRNLIYNDVKPSLALALRLERETYRSVNRKDLRPDVNWSEFL